MAPASSRRSRRPPARSTPARVAVLSDYAKGVLDADTIPGHRAARQAGVPVIVDPKKADAAIFAGATLLTPNVDEMAHFPDGSTATRRRSRLPPGPRHRSRSMRSS